MLTKVTRLRILTEVSLQSRIYTQKIQVIVYLQTRGKLTVRHLMLMMISNLRTDDDTGTTDTKLTSYPT